MLCCVQYMGEKVLVLDCIYYQHSETKQTAHATIGNGQIIVRSDPNASLGGLNRDVANSLTEKNTANVNIKLDPLFEYVDAAIAAKNIPTVANEGIKFLDAPSAYIEKAWKDFMNNLPWNANQKKVETSPTTAPLSKLPTMQEGS